MHIWKQRRLFLSDHRSRYQRLALSMALVLLLLTGLTLFQTPHAHAASSGPIIHWDNSMIYTGQNNGNPWGPVGEIAVVHGENFTANQALSLVVVAGDSNTDPAHCQPPTPGSSVLVGTVNADASGHFDATFAWPAGVGQVGQQRENSICSYTTSGATLTLVSSNDDGPFTVLTDNKPSFSLSTSSVAAGSTLTVSGKNWVPVQPLSITIAGCADCDPGTSSVASATTTSIGQNSGTFSLSIPIPASATPGNYIVNVFTQSGTLDAYHLTGVGIQRLAVTASLATPTPAAGPSPTATLAQTPIASPVATAIGNNVNSSSSSGGSNSGLMIILIVLALLLIAIGGIIYIVLARRQKQAATSTSSTNGVAAGQFNQPSTGQADNLPGRPFPGQNWPGNQQMNASSGNVYPQQPFQSFDGASAQRACARCGSPLAANTLQCNRCGWQNTYQPDPQNPTRAY